MFTFNGDGRGAAGYGHRGAMLEAICAYRMKMKKVVVLWAPSHEGVTR